MDEFQQMSFDDMAEGGKPTQSSIEPAQDPAINSSTAMTMYSDQVTMDREDILIPRLRLAQGLTAEVQDGTAKPGMWVMTGQESRDDLTVVPLMFARRRELVDDEFNILCKSDDSRVGYGTPGGDCSKCPMNQWSEGKKGARIPPKCTFIYSYIVYVAEFKAPAILEFKRTGIQAGKLVNTMAAQRGLANFAVKLKSSASSGPKGTYYSPSVQPTTVTADVLAEAKGAWG